MATWNLDTDPLTWSGQGFDPYAPVKQVAAKEGFQTGKLGFYSPDTGPHLGAQAGSELNPERVRQAQTKGNAYWSSVGLDYNPADLSESGFSRTQQAFAKSYGLAQAAKPGTRQWAFYQTQANLVWQDYTSASRQLQAQREQAAAAQAEAARVARNEQAKGQAALRGTQQLQSEVLRAQKEAEAGAKTKKKDASVRVGSNIQRVTTQRRESTSTPAATARTRTRSSLNI